MRAWFCTLIVSCDLHIFNGPRDGPFRSCIGHLDKILICIPNRRTR